MFLVSNGNSKRGLLIIIISVLMLAGFVFTNMVSFYYLKLSLHKSISETELPQASTEVYSEITLGILPAVVASSMLANDRFIQHWLLNEKEEDSTALTGYLSDIKNNNSALISFLVSAQSQQYYNSEGLTVYESKDDPQASWYFDFISSTKIYDLNIGPNIDSGHTPTIFINYKVKHNNQLIGVVGLGLELNVINHLLEDFQTRYNQNLYFIDSSGKIISKSEGAMLTTEILSNLPSLSNSLSNTNLHYQSSFEYKNKQGHFLLNLKYIPELNWWMLIEQEEELTFNEVRTILYTNAFIGLGTVFVILLIVSWVINFFHKQLETLATTDALTQLGNRPTVEHHIKTSLLQNERSPIPLSILMIDVDRFKDINDEYGHLVGDHVLKTLSSIIKKSTRQADCVGRWGGEEFVVMAHNTSIDNAKILADKIRLNIEECSKFPKQVTVSIGVTSAMAEDTLDKLLSRADIALYQAKHDGRNCVRIKKATE